ncbi:MAG: helix-turn-helix transcriptional regulator [Pyrinomonadaceae bacterium]
MGSAARPRPMRLAEKLLEIRTKLGLSQNEMIRRMGLVDDIIQADVSAYELNQREPPLVVLLNYARAANILVEVLIDDEFNLPGRLPANPKSEGIKRKKPSPNKNK